MEIEVSLKVRSAIKAKLLELGCHVDEELPDYVMILVANRRTKAQMDSDLNLFLGDNTSKFTTWLHHVLKKLEQVTLPDKKEPERRPSTSTTTTASVVPVDAITNDGSDSDTMKSDGKRKRRKSEKDKDKPPEKEKIQFSLKRSFGQTEFDSKESEKKSKDKEGSSNQKSLTSQRSSEPDSNNANNADHDVLNLAEEQDDFGIETDLDELRRIAMESKKTKDKEKAERDAKKHHHSNTKKDRKHSSGSSSRKLDIKSIGMVQGILQTTDSKRKRSSPERSRSPPKRLKSVVQKSVPVTEEYDPTRPTITNKLSSVVHVAARPKREIEANKNLLFKAMKEAEIDNVKRDQITKERDKDRHHESRLTRSDRRRSRSRSRERHRHHHSHTSPRSGSRDRVARNPNNDRSRSRSPIRREHWPSENILVRSKPLELFTRKNRGSIKDRLGERIGSRLAEYKEVLDELEMDQGEELDIKNFQVIVNNPERVKDRTVTEAEDAESVVEIFAESDSPIGIPPKRISIKVNMNSSDEDSEDSENEDENSKEKQTNGSRDHQENAPEIILTIADDDELLPPSDHNTPILGSIPKQAFDKLADLRARLASLNSSKSDTPSPKLSDSIPVGQALPVPRPHVIIRPAMITLPGVTQGANISSVPLCKYWPNCSYPNNCKYQHPKCKYGPLCKKPACPYKHEKKPVVVAAKKKICSWFPKCHTLDCPFFHPKPCRYGINCTDVKCPNYHPGGSIGEAKKGVKPPAVHLLKWSKENVKKEDDNSSLA